jgi:hypothetical protein
MFWSTYLSLYRRVFFIGKPSIGKNLTRTDIECRKQMAGLEEAVRSCRVGDRERIRSQESLPFYDPRLYRRRY